VTAEDILARASRELAAAAERARLRDAEIVRQRAAALAHLPHTAAPIAFAAKPPPTREQLERQIADQLATAEREAQAKARLADDEALAKWQLADADAYAKYTRSIDEARNAYLSLLDTLHGAIHSVAAAEQARFIRDRAFAAADNEYRAAKTAGYDAYARASALAREQAIAAIERARQEADSARRALDAETEDVGDETISGGGPAGTIVATCDDQLARSKADAGREAAAIVSRMREDLAALGQPV
jgi:hypothetical protein